LIDKDMANCADILSTEKYVEIKV
jgi:hypothetical protein